MLQGVNEEVDRLIRLSGSLLTLTRADAGQIPLTFEAVDVGDIVAGIVEQVRPAATDKGIAIGYDPGPPLTVKADEDLMLQLMLNLLDNAIKYTPRGGKVSVGWSTDGKLVALQVKDTGIGIAPEHLPYLFDPLLSRG